MITKINILLVFSAAYLILLSILAYSGELTSGMTRTDFFFSSSIVFLIVWWVKEDMLKRKLFGLFDFPAYLYCGLPVLLPYYLIKTRGWKGALLTTGFLTLVFGPSLIAEIIYIMKWE